MAKLDQPLIGDLQSGGPVGNPRAAPGNTHVGKPMVKAKGLLETAAENFKPHFSQYAAGEFEVGQAEARGEKIANEWMNNVNKAAKLQNVNAELGEMEGELAMGPPTAEDDVRINELVAKRNKLMDKVDRGFMSTTDVQLRIEKMARELAVNHPNPDRVYTAAGSTLARDFGVEFKLLQAAEKQQAASKDAWRKDILNSRKSAYA